MSVDLRKIRPSFFLCLLAAAAIGGTVVVACDDTDPSPIGVHFDDAGDQTDSAPPPDMDAGDEGGDDGSSEASDDGGDEGGDASEDAADAADAHDAG